MESHILLEHLSGYLVLVAFRNALEEFIISVYRYHGKEVSYVCKWNNLCIVLNIKYLLICTSEATSENANDLHSILSCHTIHTDWLVMQVCYSDRKKVYCGCYNQNVSLWFTQRIE